MKVRFFVWICIFMYVLAGSRSVSGQSEDGRGMYFSKKAYDGQEIHHFSDAIDQLPEPVMEEETEWVPMYRKCWEIAFDHFKKPPEGSPFVSNILDEAFNSNIFQWDMIFMVMFARYGDHIFPAVNSLDNFYIRQHASGYICRELSERDGSDFVYEGRSHTINPPLFSWAEMESFKNTGDSSRLELVLPVLEKYVDWLNTPGRKEEADDPEYWYRYGRKAGNSPHQLYWNTGLGSGMDNTPREGNGWVDMSCQMVIQYRNLAAMSRVLGFVSKAEHFEREGDAIAERINAYCWNEADGLYYDVDSLGRQVKWKTAACFWPLLAGVASVEQCERLVANLLDTNTFWRRNVVPTLAADQEGYDPYGGYWLGSVWAPTNYAIIKGLQQNGYEDLATQISYKYMKEIECVFDSTGTFWENYSPDFCLPGNRSKPDFVGWTGIAPISLLIENILGFRVDAPKRTLIWRITRTDRHGIRNLRVGQATVSTICSRRSGPEECPEITLSTDKDLNLMVLYAGKHKQFSLIPGRHLIQLNE